VSYEGEVQHRLLKDPLALQSISIRAFRGDPLRLVYVRPSQSLGRNFQPPDRASPAGGPHPRSRTGILPPFSVLGTGSGSIRGTPGSTRRDRQLEQPQLTLRRSRPFVPSPRGLLCGIRSKFKRCPYGTPLNGKRFRHARRGETPPFLGLRVPIFSIVLAFRSRIPGDRRVFWVSCFVPI